MKVPKECFKFMKKGFPLVDKYLGNCKLKTTSTDNSVNKDTFIELKADSGHFKFFSRNAKDGDLSFRK